MRVIKNIIGIFCIMLCLGPICLTIENKQPLFLFEIPLFAFVAFLLFRKTKKEKECKVLKQTGSVASVSIVTEYNRSAIPEDIAKEMRKYYTLMQAQRDAEIMADSYRLASTTVNLETFCMRYDLAMEKAYTLLQAEYVGVRGIKKLKCHNACVAVINAAHSLKIRMLADYEQSAFSQAEGLKTDRGKLNRYIKIKQILTKAEPTFMFMEEYENLIAKVDAQILSLGGVVL